MSLVRLAFLVSVLISLQACRIIQTVPQGGTIISSSGNYNCSVTEQCIINIPSGEPFNETFTAVPQPGYIFKNWKNKKKSLCKGKSTPCALDLSGDFTDHDVNVFLEPVFVLGYDQYIMNALNLCDTDNPRSFEIFIDEVSYGWIRPGTRITVPMSAQSHELRYLDKDGTVIGTDSVVPFDDEYVWGWGCTPDSFSLSDIRIVSRDSDGDGYSDEYDAFPKDASKWGDIEGNGGGTGEEPEEFLKTDLNGTWVSNRTGASILIAAMQFSSGNGSFIVYPEARKELMDRFEEDTGKILYLAQPDALRGIHYLGGGLFEFKLSSYGIEGDNFVMKWKDGGTIEMIDIDTIKIRGATFSRQ